MANLGLGVHQESGLAGELAEGICRSSSLHLLVMADGVSSLCVSVELGSVLRLFSVGTGHSSIEKVSGQSIILRRGGGEEVLERLVFRERVHHPLEGLWAAVYGAHGIEFQVISLVQPNSSISSPLPVLDSIPPPVLGQSYLRVVKVSFLFSVFILLLSGNFMAPNTH